MGFTHSLARALGPEGITVNCLVPSIVGTDTVNRHARRPRCPVVVAEQSVHAATSSQDDLVGAILWLASPASAFTTGQTIMADGGRIFL